MWKQLLPSHWTIPRRPRKSWQELYTTKVRFETERTRKLWDDLLSKASTILQHGDQLQAIEKIVNEAQYGGRHKPAKGYDIDYASGVVCERNSILNLAVIHQRHSKLFNAERLELRKVLLPTCLPSSLICSHHISPCTRDRTMVSRSETCRY